jgi:hypothetical protein
VYNWTEGIPPHLSENPLLWNGFKRLAAQLSADEKTDLFSRTGGRVYSLG